MVTILCALVSIFEFRVRSRASLELELIALRHQVTVMRRQRPGRPQLSSLDRLLWVWLYRIWPQVIDAMVLVKPATVVQWHRKGFRLYWRWRSRSPGRPRVTTEIRDLIRCMSKANPLWGAPPYGQKIHLSRPATSRRFAMVIMQEPTQSLAALHGPLTTNVRIPREQQDVALPLVISLSVEMLDIFAERSPQRALTEENHLRQALLLHRPDPALRIGIQIRVARRQHERFDLP